MTPIQRREAIKQLFCITAGMALIPSCMNDRSKSGILLSNITISAAEEAMLGELCETILPKTSTPGAKDISSHLFVLKMVDDCRKKEDQDRFISGMKAFQERCKSTAGKDFVDSTMDQRNTVLASILADKDEESDLKYFFKTVKGLTVQSFTASEFFMTKVQVYELVPGRYHGCVPA
jgi:hypothetical protein